MLGTGTTPGVESRLPPEPTTTIGRDERGGTVLQETEMPTTMERGGHGGSPTATAEGPGVQPTRETTTTTTSVVGTMMRPPMRTGQISTIYEGHIIEHRGPGQRPILHKSVTDVIRDRGTVAPEVRHDVAREPLQRPGVAPAGHVTPITSITPRSGKPGTIGETTTIHHPGSLGAITSTQTKTEMAVPAMNASLMAKLKGMINRKPHTTEPPASHPTTTW